MTYTLYKGDCLVEMDKIADKSIDMILCDLPYGTTACKWDIIIPFEPLWEHYERIIKDNGAMVFTSSQPFTTDLINSNRKLFKYEWIWDKKMVTGVGQVKIKPMKCHENILIFSKGKTTYNPQFREVKSPFGKLSNTTSKSTSLKTYDEINFNVGVGYPKTIIEFPRPNNLSGGGYHPTQKPVALMEYLIKTYTNEGETVLDNCMGSGTTGVACKNTNRNFIGIEMDENYFNIAQKRIEDVKCPENSTNTFF
jgi:site-specific DNA-methyltransferase (adenine-specific)